MSVKPEPATATTETILGREDREGGITYLTLNRPTAYNSLSSDLMAALQAALDETTTDPSVRVLVIQGAGRGFSAGHDLKEVRGLATAEARRALMAQCCELMLAIVHSPKPVIAKVHGAASAAGCQLVASCDLAIAASDARFATPGVNIGLFCHTPMVALGRNVARKHAMEMLLTGEMADAETAARIGLINAHVPAAELDGAVMEMATKIAGKSSHIRKIGKQAFYRQLEMGLEEAYAYAARVMVENMAARDAEEGIAAFVEKRAPAWHDA
jgi:enoyl-CoA hydratase/carnithine racemase